MRRDRQRLQDILEALTSVMVMLGQKTQDEFLNDEILRYAVAHKLTVVGEAVSRLGPEVGSAHTSVPWPDIVGLRNILVHEYFGIYWPLVYSKPQPIRVLRFRHEVVRTRRFSKPVEFDGFKAWVVCGDSRIDSILESL